ncbi:MAG: sulfur carrier protein ThiS [Solirubrobacterales bacterium]
MRIVVNGSEREVPERLTVAELVLRLPDGGANGRGVAVAVDAQVVPRSEWDGAELSEGQRVEVLGAIQGG